MNRAKRIGVGLLVVMLLVSTLATTVFASEIGCGNGGASWTRTYKIYKLWGQSIKLRRDTAGVAKNGVLETNYHGIYTFSVTGPGGYKNCGTWNAQAKTSRTVVGATTKKGYYSVTVSAVSYNTNLYSGWVTLPKYKLSW